MKIGGMSIADHIFADVTDVSFEQRTLKSRGDYDRKALWSREGVSRTLVFNPVFQHACLVTVFIHAQCTIDVRQSFT